MATTEAIASATAAGSADVVVADGASIQVWTYPRLGINEALTVYRYVSSDTATETEVIEDGKVVELNRTKSSMLLNGPANFRIKKPETATATAVYYDA